MANFVDGKLVNKISYAASIGLNDIPDTLVGEYKNLLSDSFISVREETGAELLKRECCIDNVFVALDPNLLLKHDDYKKIERTVRIKGRYIFCYFFLFLTFISLFTYLYFIFCIFCFNYL